jgi:hypothetical protein
MKYTLPARIRSITPIQGQTDKGPEAKVHFFDHDSRSGTTAFAFCGREIFSFTRILTAVKIDGICRDCLRKWAGRYMPTDIDL